MSRNGDARVALDAMVQLHRDDTERALRACHVSISVGPQSQASVLPSPKVVQGQFCPAVSVTVSYDASWEPSLRFRYQLMYARRCCVLQNACIALCAKHPTAVKGVKMTTSASLLSQRLVIARFDSMLVAGGSLGEGRPVTIQLAGVDVAPALQGDIFTVPVSWGHH